MYDSLLCCGLFQCLFDCLFCGGFRISLLQRKSDFFFISLFFLCLFEEAGLLVCVEDGWLRLIFVSDLRHAVDSGF